MADDFNNVQISGRLTRPPEIRETPSGLAVCDLTLASNQYIKGEQISVYPKVTIWNKQAKYYASLHTGDHLLVQGQLVDDNLIIKDKEGIPRRTSGRLKIDRAKIFILHSNGLKEEIPDEIPKL